MEQEIQELKDLKVSLELSIDCVTLQGAPNSSPSVYYHGYPILSLFHIERCIL